MSEQALIATLGSEPQVVTLALDLLRAQGYPIAAVKVVHPVPQKAPYISAGMNALNPEGHCPKATDISPWYGVHTMGESVQAALKKLNEEFRKQGECSYQAVPIQKEGWPVSDIAGEEETAALLRTLYRVVLAEKRAGRIVHLSIAGGRKIMAAYGMVVAQLLFDDNDHVWHLHSKDWRPGNDRVMHARPGDAVSLLPVPVLRWSAVSPVLTELAVRKDPWEAWRQNPVK